MELQEEGMVDCKRITFSNTLESNNEMVLSPTHFLHSWESERKLIEVLIKVSEETYEDDQKQMDQIIICNGWDDAVHGWRRDNSSYSFHTLKKSKKSRREEKNGSNCVFCAEMLPTSERKTVQDVCQPGRSSKSSDSTVAPIFTGKNTNAFAERTTPPVSQTKYCSAASQRYTSELTQETRVQDNKAETEVNPSQGTECKVTHSLHQPTPVKKHFSVLPPVKMANGDEMFVSGFKAGRTFCLGIQNGNRDLQTVSVVSKHDDKDNLRIRAHGCNMAMLQVSKVQKAGTPVPLGLTRIPYMNAMGHWCWQYSLMQGHENLAINGAPASKVMECHSIRVQPSKIIKQHTKHLKQDNFSKSTFSHSAPGNKHLSRIRQRNVAARALLPGIPQPGPPLLSGTSIPISILPH